ncbi:uncharacterized protein B0I36DRAFT_160183 [Microdochium trichocladiopsis]|uniref:Uncharacterized protein n=1 Tax=Microdochium trichocladiopsis TaxID=1682393 RepID=A0A9P9BKF4_9PEZI|nr:uncharacterized protein B0I36DRAFT_160183 [Microdochium trichocladiopsis]KAH7026574.1 hypothetical protein B0I36DRAFT_160183 [Microdochium trichocladiopsis]
MSGVQISMDQNLIIILSTVIPGTVVIVAGLTAFLCIRRRRRGTLFNRGITPIGDDEIATWKIGPHSEKEALRPSMPPHHTPTPSTTSFKSPSVIQYTTSARPSFDLTSPVPLLNKKISIDLPQFPGTAVLARAPNARSGLTDETVPGDEPFVDTLKRQPSKLSKRQTSSRASLDQRGRGSRTNSLKNSPDHGKSLDLPRQSSDGSRKGHSRIYSTSSVPPVLSSSECAHFSALSPPPPPSRGRKEDIGRAIG